MLHIIDGGKSGDEDDEQAASLDLFLSRQIRSSSTRRISIHPSILVSD